MTNQIGLIGLGVMGENIAKNLADNNIQIVGFNSSEEKLNKIREEIQDGLFHGHTTINEVVESLEKPRVILLMVPAGEATKKVIHTLSEKLSEEDWVLDGGNSNYKDSEENGKELEKKNIHFAGLGVSGGEKGARYGPALMLGSKSNNVGESIKNYLDKIAAIDSDKNKCFKIYSGFGAGHFIKMVHNGIEYAEMQLISEVYDLLRKHGKDKDYIASVFSRLEDSDQGSYLFEITKNIINKKVEGKSILEQISSVAKHKGTGKWTIEAGIELGVAIPSISAAFDTRVISQNTLSTNQKVNSEKIDIDFEDLYKAIYQLRVSIFMQGLNLIKKGSIENEWSIHLNDVLDNWKSGCIIRTKLLDDLPLLINVLDNTSNKKFNELLAVVPITSDIINKANKSSVPTPCMSASLNWILSTFSESLPTNLIQAQRDYFGSHNVELINSSESGPIHIEWE